MTMELLQCYNCFWVNTVKTVEHRNACGYSQSKKIIIFGAKKMQKCCIRVLLESSEPHKVVTLLAVFWGF